MYSDDEVDITCEELHGFYGREEVNRLENEYEEYLLKKDRLLSFYRLNSWVFLSRKREQKTEKGSKKMEFTGERFIPGQTDIELEIEHLNRYQFARQFVKDKVVLDAACGEGYGSDLLARDASKVYGIDLSEESITYARNRYDNRRISYQVASICQLPFEADTFDVIVSFETLEHVDGNSQIQFLQEAERVLKQDGLLVISTPNHRVYKERGENHFHVKELEYEEFRALLEKRFPFVSFFSQRFEIANSIASPSWNSGTIESELSPGDAEYLIAVCSYRPVEKICGRSVIRNDGKLQKLMDWAIRNHETNEKNNLFIADAMNKIENLQRREAECAKKLNDAQTKYDALSAENQTLNQELCNKSGQIELLLETERTLNRKLAEKDAANQQLQQTIRNKEGHIQLLLESDRELERIKFSRSWRFMGYAWKLRDTLIPKGSKRRLFGKMLVKFIKHPIRFLRKCTPHKISRFFRTLRREGVEMTSRRLDDCLIGTEIQKQELRIEAVPEAPAKTAADYAHLEVPQWTDPQVSIVIPVYNQFEYTYLCIKSIVENSGDISYEILIADDCSTDLTQQLDKIISGVKVIRNQENLRFLRNCNHAAQFAKGRYILFLNNDTQVQKDWLAPLVELIERDEKNGMVGSKLVYPDGRLQEAGGILWKDGSAWNYGNRSDPDAPEYNYVKEVDYISGAAIMIRRTLWEEIGGFDERFAPAYCEDSDLAFEVRKHGCRVLYQPLSVVVHFEGVSNGTDTSSGQKAYQVINQKKFFEKWKDVLEKEHFENGYKPFVARERGQGKKFLLMVDHYVPQFDKDAGSRTVFQYIQLFVRQGYHVKFIGDNFFPHQPYTQVLQQMGVEVLYGPYYANHWKEWLQENGQDIGYAFLNRPHIAVNYIDEVRQYTPARIIYYGHDLHFLRERREYELTGDSALLRSSEEWKKKELALMRKADWAYYPSSVEEQEIHAIAPDVQVKAIPAYLFSNVEDRNFQANKRKDLMFVGGFGHRPNVDAVKWLAEEIMPHLVQLLPDVTVHILGSNPPEDVKRLESPHLKIEGFVTDAQLEEFYSNCRLDIVPLRYGAGIKGKVVEAMRYGMPVVTTSVGAEGIDGAEEILAVEDDAKAFAERVAQLYGDERELAKRCKASLEYVRMHFSPENAAEVIGPEFDMK